MDKFLTKRKTSPNDAGSSASKRQAMTASTMSHREHVLERHENYIGSVNPERKSWGLPNKVHASSS